MKTTRSLTPLALLALSAMSGCAEKSPPADPAPTAGKTSGEIPFVPRRKAEQPRPVAPTKAPESPFQALPGVTAEAIAAGLQGVWLVPAHEPGAAPDVWEFAGAEGQLLRGQLNQGAQGPFEILAPCRIDFRTSLNRFPRTFALADGKLYAGPGAAGVVVGDSAVVCSATGVFVHGPAGCSYFSQLPPHGLGPAAWKVEAATCARDDKGFNGKVDAGGESLALAAVPGGYVEAGKVAAAKKAESFDAARAEMLKAAAAAAAVPVPAPGSVAAPATQP